MSLTNSEIQSEESPQQSTSKNETIPKLSTRRSRRKAAFVYATHVMEDHGTAIYDIEFCNYLSHGEPIIFATCGSNRVSIYECKSDAEITLLQCYSDANGDEIYYSCCWSVDAVSSKPILAVGGYKKIIRIIDPMTKTANKHLMGHGGSIYDLKIHPRNVNLLLSASQDYTIRLWNIQANVCVAIFGGVGGHRSQALSADFDTTGSRIATCSLDGTVKIWHLDRETVREAIEKSNVFDCNRNEYSFKAVVEHFPDRTVSDIHRSYVDCVKWMGNFILSKACENSIICWLPDGQENAIRNASSLVIRKFEYGGDQQVFVRFSMDIPKTYMAMGTVKGRTVLWRINEDDSEHAMHLKHKECTATVRATAFSRDCKTLISVCNDGSIWKWNKVE